MERIILHDGKKQRFELTESSHTAYVEYELSGKTMDLTHTYVPGKLEGKGIASLLVKHALDFARENHLKIIPSCSFVEIYLQRHKEYEDLL